MISLNTHVPHVAYETIPYDGHGTLPECSTIQVITGREELLKEREAHQGVDVYHNQP